MHNGPRQMLQVGEGHWIIRCRLCWAPRKMHFATARECHDWWRTHEASGRHGAAMQREPDRRRRKREEDALLRLIFPREAKP